MARVVLHCIAPAVMRARDGETWCEVQCRTFRACRSLSRGPDVWSKSCMRESGNTKPPFSKVDEGTSRWIRSDCGWTDEGRRCSCPLAVMTCPHLGQGFRGLPSSHRYIVLQYGGSCALAVPCHRGGSCYKRVSLLPTHLPSALCTLHQHAAAADSTDCLTASKTPRWRVHHPLVRPD